MFAAALAWRFITFNGFTNDHYAHFALAQQLLLGERPIRDFSDPGWPLMYLISAAAWQIAGGTIAVEWTVVAIGFAAGAALTMATALRLSGSIVLATIVTLLELAIFPRTYSYPKMLAYGAAAFAMLAVAASPTTRRLLLMSGVIATAFLLRHDHGVYIGIASVVCVAVATGRHWRLGLRRVAILTIATVVLIGPWTLYVAANGGLVDYFDRALEYARLEANATTLKTWPRFERLPDQPILGLARPNRPLVQITWKPGLADPERQALERRYGLEHQREGEDAHFYYVRNTDDGNLRALADDGNVAGSVGLGRVSRPAWREILAFVSPMRVAPGLHTLRNAQTFLYWLFWILPIVAAAVAVLCAPHRHAPPRDVTAAVIGLSAMALLVDSGFLRDPLAARLADTIVVPAILGAWLLGIVWVHQWRAPALQFVARMMSIVLLFVTTASAATVAELAERIDYSGIRDGLSGVQQRARFVSALLASPHRQTLAPPSRVSAALMPFFSYVDRCTSPEDQLLVTGDYADVLVLAGRGFAADGVVFGVWYSSVAHQAQTVEQMQHRPALFTLLIGEREFRTRYPQVFEYVQREYTSIGNIDVSGADPLRLMASRHRTRTGVDRQTGWPCFW